MRKAGQILRACLDMVSQHVRPGETTGELDRLAEQFIRDSGGLPAFKGYQNYPATLCTSVNDECVHGIPGKRELKDGDIVSLDCGVIVDELYTDACITVGVGAISKEAENLLNVTQFALQEVLTIIRAGVRVGDISATIQALVEKGGCSAVRSLTGHGLGYSLHQFPDIPNIGKKGTGPMLPANTVVAIEPIVSLGSAEVKDGGDGWTLVISDGALSAHFEHTILITQNGCEVLA